MQYGQGTRGQSSSKRKANVFESLLLSAHTVANVFESLSLSAHTVASLNMSDTESPEVPAAEPLTAASIRQLIREELAAAGRSAETATRSGDPLPALQLVKSSVPLSPRLESPLSPSPSPAPRQRPVPRICISWNKGKCAFPGVCNFAHACTSCRGDHQVKDCPLTPPTTGFDQHRSRLPGQDGGTLLK